MKAVRWILGKIILLMDFLTRPSPKKRTEEAQAQVDNSTAKLALYQFHACPFCVKVRREIRRNNLNIELRDAKNDQEHKDTLTTHGGRHKVPCLRIESDNGDVAWMYESSDIINYLDKQFAAA